MNKQTNKQTNNQTNKYINDSINWHAYTSINITQLFQGALQLLESDKVWIWFSEWPSSETPTIDGNKKKLENLGYRHLRACV